MSFFQISFSPSSLVSFWGDPHILYWYLFGCHLTQHVGYYSLLNLRSAVPFCQALCCLCTFSTHGITVYTWIIYPAKTDLRPFELNNHVVENFWKTIWNVFSRSQRETTSHVSGNHMFDSCIKILYYSHSVSTVGQLFCKCMEPHYHTCGWKMMISHDSKLKAREIVLRVLAVYTYM